MGIDYNLLPDHIKEKVDKKGKESYKMGSPAKSVPQDHSMNKTEQNYSNHLEILKQYGDIKDYLFEPFNIRLGKRTFYKPDFLVVNGNNEIEIHEVKGYWRDDAKVKIKVAAERIPWFRFKAVYNENGHWKYQLFEPFRGT